MNGLMILSAAVQAKSMVLLPTAVKLEDAWKEFWGAITGPAAGILKIATWVGVVIVVAAVFAWLFERKRGGGVMSGQKSQGLIWAIVLGAVLAGPDLLIPLVLKIADWVVNTVTGLLSAA